MVGEALRVGEGHALRVEAALHAAFALVERRDQHRDVVELRQLLVRAHADDGAQRQAVAIDEVLVAARLGLVLRRQARECLVAKARRIARGESQRPELGAVVALVAQGDRAGVEVADEDARASMTQSERSKSRPPVCDSVLVPQQRMKTSGGTGTR